MSVAKVIPIILVLLSFTPHRSFAGDDASSDSTDKEQGQSSVVDKEPELVKFVRAPYPPEQLRLGIEGTVLLDILVNEYGLVDGVSVAKGLAPQLDSAAKSAAMQFVFTPALIDKKPIAVMLRFEYPFFLKQVLDSIKPFENFTGIVSEKQTNRLLAGIILELSRIDSSAQTGKDVFSTAYLKKIGTFLGQRLENGPLVTTTDTLGRFFFKSLPVGQVRLTIGGQGYKTLTDTVVIRSGATVKNRYTLERSTFAENELVAYGRLTRKKLDVAKEEETYGRTDDLNNLLTVQPGVASVPNAQSLMLVNGDGPYDNTFMLRGIPIFEPSHFAGVSYFDRSIFSLGTPLDIELLTTGISGLYSGGSGSVLRVDPGIVHDPIHVARPELLVNYGTLGADLTLSVPMRKGDDLYQLSYRPADKYALWFLNEYKVVDENLPSGYPAPVSYTDVQFLGSQKAGRARVRQLLWLSEDIYSDSGFTREKPIPWGICIVSLDSLRSSWCKSIGVGGALQHWFESRGGLGAYSKDVERTSAALTAEGPEFFFGSNHIATNILAQYVPWKGRILIPEEHEGALKLNADSISSSGYQGEIRFGQSYQKTGGLFQYGANLCEGVVWPAGKVYVDPGLWVLFPFGRNSVRVSGGLITSQPDIRGMPSQGISEALVHTYNGSVRAMLSPLSWLDGSLEAYVKYRPRQLAYGDDPRFPLWTGSDDKYLSCGMNGEIKAALGKRIVLRTVQSVSRSELIGGGRRAPYDWDVPWTNKTVLSYSFIDTVLTAFLIGNFYAGLPYRDVIIAGGGLGWDDDVKRAENYNRIDLKFQLCEPVPDNRTLMQYDGYVLLSDLVGLFYSSDKRPGTDFLNVLYHVHFGVRVHLRF
jgi:TonB family protein